MSYQVIGYPICPYVHRILIAMNLKNLDYTLTFLNPHESIPAWFAEYSPLKLIPVIKTPTDDVLFESVVILEYLEEAHPERPLHPKSIIERAKQRAWVEVLSMLYSLQHQVILANTAENYQQASIALNNHLATIEEAVNPNTRFFNSDLFQMTEIILAPFFYRQHIIAKRDGSDCIIPYPKLQRVRSAIMDIPAVQTTIFEDLEMQLVESYRDRHGVLFS